MQNYYRLLGIPATASPTEIGLAYQRERTRLRRLARRDRAMQARLQEVEVGYQILSHPRRRVAYDQLRRDAPDEPAAQAYLQQQQRLSSLGRAARRFNLALLACCLLLLLDWALPLRHHPRERALSRVPVAVTSYQAAPQLAYRVTTAHARFVVPSQWQPRGSSPWEFGVWQTPLLGVVRRVRTPTGQLFEPRGGAAASGLGLLVLLVLGLAGYGAWPERPAETYISAALTGGMLAALALLLMLWS